MGARTSSILAGILLFLSASFWWLSRPYMDLPFDIPDGDATRGEYVAIAAGCASCHGKNYAGGEALHSPFGTFYAPNITPAHWQASREEFAIALLNGVDPSGKHLYPAFPYSSYQNMIAQDVGDLYAYLRTLPTIDLSSKPNDLPFYARWRRVLGIWKKLRSAPPEPMSRGAYLVEALGHCQECHTPRNRLGILKYGRAFEGTDIFTAEGTPSKVPNLVSGESVSWSVSEIESYLLDGFTPDYDSVGGEMVDVIENTSRLTEEDRAAMASYVESLHKPSQ